MPIQKFFVTIFRIFTNKVSYFSNQTTLYKAHEVEEAKGWYKVDFYGTMNYIKNHMRLPKKFSDSEISDFFEKGFYKNAYDALSKLQKEED